jgi:hypothetical protein
MDQRLFFFDRRYEGKGNQLVPVELRLFKGLDNAKRHAVVVRLEHDPLADGPLEPENARERLYHVVHTVDVVVVKQDLITGNTGGMLFQDGIGSGFRQRGQECLVRSFAFLPLHERRLSASRQEIV